MSKVNELRRKASDAVRGREFDRAIELYLKICQFDPSNGTPRNELGDLYLKTGNTLEAIDSFSLSARLYRDFGLTNNAVAVYKKILRHDPNHLDSLWGLAEIRREQGMDAEASAGFLEFLSRAEQVPDAGRQEFFRHAAELIKSMCDDLEILSRLEEIYRAADRGDDVAKVLIAKAQQAHLEGELEVRDRYIEHAREACEILDSLPAYHEYLDVVQPPEYGADAEADDAAQGDSVQDPGVIELDADPTPASFDVQAPGEIDFEDSAPKTIAISTDDLDDFSPDPGPARETASEPEAIDLGFDFEADALDQAINRTAPAVEEVGREVPEEKSAPRKPTGTTGKVNLLDEILADGSFDVEQDQRRQVETIAQEMQGQIAGDVAPDDFGGQYELGVVYMDMGLFEQAIAAFDAAARGKDYRLGALEMRGTCLLRLGRDGEAMDSFRDGLAIKGAPDKAYLGLLYGVGCCLELRGALEEAREHFRRVAAIDERFLDVSRKLERMGEPR